MPEPVRSRQPFFNHNLLDHSGQAEAITGALQSDDKDDKDYKDNHIVVRNRCMRQQSGEH